MTKQGPTKSVRITHGKVDTFRRVLRSCPVKNLPADASERALIDAALDIAAAVVENGPDLDRLPRAYRSMARWSSGPDAEADLVERAPDEFIYVADHGLMVLTGMRRVESAGGP